MGVSFDVMFSCSPWSGVDLHSKVAALRATRMQHARIEFVWLGVHREHACEDGHRCPQWKGADMSENAALDTACSVLRSEEHTSELQSRGHLVCRLLLEKKKYN